MPSREGCYPSARRSTPPAGAFLLLVYCLLSLLSGCSTLESRMETIAAAAHLEQRRIPGNDFELFALERRRANDDIHIYIEGDGRPWTGGGTRISIDPTPRQPSALELMADDPLGQLYLGRPCYFGSANSAPCESRLWTYERYGETVVAAMTEALRKWAMGHAHGRITLIGYSGGGVLALLIAERLPSIHRVVAIATPVDHKRWTQVHDYTPLYGSINPAEQSEWRANVERIFIFGENDDNVAPKIFAPLAARISNARIIILPKEGHDCCRHEAWHDTLQRLLKR